MGRIAKTASEKHEATLSSAITAFIKTSTAIPLSQLPQHLRSFPRRWPFPRGDIYHWIPTLNRFDDILELFNDVYGLTEGPQTQTFSRRLLMRGDGSNHETDTAGEIDDNLLDNLGFSDEGDRELIEEIIGFTRLVIENCGNRSLYASSSRLSDLLNTTSFSLLETTLRLALRLAQRYSASRLRLNGPHLQPIHQALLVQHYMFDLEKIEKIAQPFVKNVPVDLQPEKQQAKNVSDSTSFKPELLTMVRVDGGNEDYWHEYGEVSMDVNTENSTNGAARAPTLGVPQNFDSPYLASPTPVRRTSNLGTATIPKQRQGLSQEEHESSAFKHEAGSLEMTYQRISTTPLPILVKECLTITPKKFHYEILQRLRVARAIPESLQSRRTMIAIRLLAIANLTHIYPEQVLQQKVLQQDSEAPRRFQLPHQLCNLIHPPGNGAAGIPKSLQSVALETLEGLTNHKGKGSDVCAELGFSASHGVLSYVVRKAVSESAVDENEVDEFQDREWRDSLFSLVSTIPRSNQRSSEALLSSGLIELLVEALNYRTTKAEIDHPRILNFLDTYVYSTGNGFNALVEAKGLDSLSGLLASQVDLALQAVNEGKGMPQDYKTSVTDYQIPFFQQQILRALVKFLNHVMGFTGTPFDRVLRNLIESSQLLNGLRVIISNPQLYGSNVWSGAVNVFGNFIHSEPTSYAAIAEVGLTKAFLETVTQQSLDTQPKSSVSKSDANENGMDGTTAVSPVGSSRDVQSKRSPGLHETFPRGILPSAESIAATAQAFSAICLNETGMQQFESSQALRVFFQVFISTQHVKALSSASGTEVENLGRDLDELARHHPRLKPEIIKLASNAANDLAIIARSEPCVRRFGPKLHYIDEKGALTFNEGLKPVPPFAGSGRAGPSDTTITEADVEMTDVQSSENLPSGLANVANEDSTSPASMPASNAASVAESVTIYAKFLSGFFNNATMCTAFAEADGIEHIVTLAFAPSLPWNFHNHITPNRIMRVLHTLVEHKPHLVLPSIVSRAQTAVGQLKPFLEYSEDSSIFESFVVPSNPQTEQQRHVEGGKAALVLRALIVVQASCIILSKTFTAHASRTSSHHPFATVNLTDVYAELVGIFGKIQSRCVWDLALLRERRSTGIGKSSGGQSSGISSSAAPPSGSSTGVGHTLSTHADHQLGTTVPITRSSGVTSIEDRNSTGVLYLLETLPNFIAKFFNALGKAVLPRRMPTDSYQRQNVLLIGDRLAETLLEQLNQCDHSQNGNKLADSYRSVIISKLKDVIIDAKSDSDRGLRQVLTVILQPFKIKGGLRKLGDICRVLFSNIIAEPENPGSEDTKISRPHLGETLENVLEIFALLTNHQVVIDASPQTMALGSRLDQRDRGDYFLPNQFLLEIRKQVLDVVLPMWNSAGINISTEDVISKLATILQNILEEKGEDGAFKRTDIVPQRIKPSKKVWRMRSQHEYDRLIEKGFTSDLARESLYRCNDSFIAAQEYCATYKRNASLQRHPPPSDGIATPTEIDVDQNSSTGNAGSVEHHGDSPATSPRTGNQLLASIPAAILQGPLGAQAEAILRDAGANPLPTDAYSHHVSSHSAPIDQPRERAQDREDIVTVEDLDEERVIVRADLMDRCLTILDVFHDLTFELAELIVGSTSKAPEPAEMRQEVTTTLVQSLISYQGTESLSQNAKKIAAIAHLLGIVLQEKEFFDAAQEELKDSFSGLLAFLSIPQDQKPEDAAPWIAQILLILEQILSEDCQPQQIRWEPPNPEQPTQNQPAAYVSDPIVTQEDKSELFNNLIDILPRVGKNVALGNAIVRILVILTRNRQLATRLGQKKNMQRLFVMIKQLSAVTDAKFRSGILLVLRHIIEDEDTIRQIVRAEIENAFEKPQRPVDTTTYTRNHYHLALRAPEIFVEVTNELLELQKFDRSQNPQILSLKKPLSQLGDTTDSEQVTLARDPTNKPVIMDVGMDLSNDTAKLNSENHSTQEKSKLSDMKPPVIDNLDGVIHYLLSELLSYKDVDDKETPLQSLPRSRSQSEFANKAGAETSGDIEMTSDETNGTSTPTSASIGERADKSNDEKPQFKPEEHPIYVYRCFILQCLTELLQSYNRTKVEFINYSRKIEAQNVTPSKPRSGALNYLLNSLMPIGTVQHPEDIATKKKSSTSAWAINVIVALCSRTPEKGPTKRRDAADVEDEPDLLFVRKFVLEHTLRTYKETIVSSDPLEFSYSKLISMADLFDKMLAGRPTVSPSYRRAQDPPDDSRVPTQKQIAKIMFEKNFIAALTNSIADVDLKMNGAGRVVKYILRPLKLLTHTAIELSLSSDISATPGQMDEVEISSATSLSGLEDEREETPDFYRNSTLGMFEPGREDDPSSGSSDEEDDEDMYGEEYADDMEYEEEDGGHDDDVVSDEDMEMEGMEGMGPIEGLPGDMGMSVQIDIDDDEESDDEDDEGMGSEEDDDEELDDDEEGDDIEIMDEITGDDENGSLADGEDEGDWQDEGEDEIGFNPPEDGQVVLDLLGDRAQRIQSGGVSRLQVAVSESEDDDDGVEPYAGPADVDPLMVDAGGMEIEDDAAIDEGSEHDEEDEDEDYEDDALIYGGGNYATFEGLFAQLADHMEHTLNPRHALDDDPGLPFFMQGIQPRRTIRSNFPSLLRTGEVAGYRSHRHRPDRPPQNDDGINPLLDRSRQASATTAPSGGHRPLPPWIQATLDMPFSAGDRSVVVSGGGEALDALRALAANHSAIPDLRQLIEVVGNHRHHHAAHHSHTHPPHLHSIQFTVGGPRGETQRFTDIPAFPGQPARTTNTDPLSAVSFAPTATMERWQEEARMIFGPGYTEKSQRVVNSILQLLVPPAIEAERTRKLAEAAEKARKADEERIRLQAEKEAQAKREQEEREEAEKAAATAAAARAQRSQEDIQADNDQAPATEDAMEGVESSTAQAPTAVPNNAPTTEPATRVFTTIRDRQLDITHLGIDLEFLDALPEEMREEVIMGRYAEQRSAAAAAGEEPTGLNRDFLDALPPDIREELLQQEAQDRRRREREEARRRAAATGGPPRADDIDPASFMASLDPIVRQAILADADEDTIAQFPADLAAEARALSGHHRRRGVDATRIMADIERVAGASGSGSRDIDYIQRGVDGKSLRRPIVQMLDKGGIATLLRLMFVHMQGNSRGVLNGVLRNACGNHQSRGEVVSGLLAILQDGSADMGAMERTFAHLTLRAKQPTAPKTPQSIKRTSSGPALNSNETTPLMVVGHCLSALIFLAQSITRLPAFFLTEHEFFGSAKAKAKAKGKAKELRASKYPINALLSLLDRELVIENSQVMEQVASLLQIVTQPLNALLKKDKEDVAKDDTAPAAPTQETSETESTVASASTQQNAATNTQQADRGTSDPSGSIKDASKETNVEAKTEDARKLLVAPEIPAEHLQLVVRIITARDCSGKTFRDTLSTMNNLSAIPNARESFGQELITRAHQLGKTIQTDLSQLIKALQGAENELEAQSLALANFSPAGSDQAKLSRVLTALDYLFDSKSAENKDMSQKESDDMRDTATDLLTGLYEDTGFTALWYKLSACLTATQQSEKYFLNVATILLPLIESLMVVCKRLPLQDTRSVLTKGSVPTTPAPEPALRTIFFSFTNRHRKILNDLVRNNPKLMSGTFSVLVKNSTVLEFDNKRNYFNRRLHHRTLDMRNYPHPPLQFGVRRDQVFYDSYRSLHYKKPEEIKYGKLNIRFHNEEGVDAGGVTREWFQVLARQMFNPGYALFNPVASDRTTFHPNRLSDINKEHLHYFHFIGRIIGKALYENRVLDCHFSRAVYKRMLGKSVSMKDMETIDLDYTKSLQWMLENDITDIITETFSMENERFGEVEIIDLIEDGRNIPVTEENKHEYVRLVIEHRLTGSVNEQLEHFLRGFHDIVPADLISIFDEGELELLISGMPEVDVDDWKNNAEYHNYTSTSPQIQWFWRAVRSFDKEERAKLLQFVTGTGKVPLNGFKELEGMNGFTRFSIHKDYGNKDRLPSSHTCFNQLDLPEYESYEMLRKNLYTAMTTGGDYFGFA